MTELARVTSRERSLTENCGVALLKTQASLVQNLSFTVLHISSSFVFALYKRYKRSSFYVLQIEECSMRGQLIQQTPKEESSTK